MARYGRVVFAAIASAFVLTLILNVSVARADMVDDLLGESKGSVPATLAAKAAANPTGSTAATTTATGGTSGPAIVPAATPVVVDSYSTDPAQLQGGSRFTLALSLKNPGTDDAQDVVVKIGPTTGSNWGSSNELVVLGSGSAQYVGTIGAGQTNSNAAFQLMANPAAPGGMRSVPVTITWKSQGYEHTASEVVGLLVNSYVSLDTQIQAMGTQTQKRPFQVVLHIKNSGSKPVKNVAVAFSGSGAQPSNATSITVGDLAPGASKTIAMTFTAPLVGRAKVVAAISYTDDFGDSRSLQAQGWARVQRTPPPSKDDKALSLAEEVVGFAMAMLGLNG